MPVCIAGMHRSGTSMVANLLRGGGLYLGTDADLKSASQYNADGFWEHVRLVDLNEEILNRLGGGWDAPPPMPEGWVGAEPLRDLHASARAILEEFSGHEPWGWKDPRNSLTLPFWRRHLPDPKVVICVRNPLEVALSLRRRNILSYALSMILWTVYNERLLRTTRPDQRLITHYDAYAHEPREEVRRLLEFAGLTPSEDVVERACSAASADLRHHRLGGQQLVDAEVSPAVLDLYAKLCGEAGWSEQSLVRASTVAGGAIDAELPALGGNPAAAPSSAQARIEHATSDTLSGQRSGEPTSLPGRLNRSAVEVEVLRKRLEGRDATIGDLRAGIARRDTDIGGLRATLGDAQAKVNELRIRLEERGAAIGELRTRLSERDAASGELRTRLKERDAAIGELRTRLSERGAAIGELRTRGAAAQAKIADLQGWLETERRTVTMMSASWGWRLNTRYERIRKRVERQLQPSPKRRA